MNIRPHADKLKFILKKHQLLTLDEVQPKMAIECKEGVIWVTHSGDPQDYVLRPGRPFLPKGKGSVVIEAIADACVDIAEP